MTQLVNGNLCRQAVHNTPGTGVIYLGSTGLSGYATFKDALPNGSNYINYTLIDGDNKEIGIGRFVTTPYMGVTPGGYIERIQILETVVGTTYSKYDEELNNLTPITCSNSAYVICSPTTFGMVNHYPVWKTVSATPIKLPTITGSYWAASGWFNTTLRDYAECWFDRTGTAKAVYKFRIPMDFYDSTELYLRATFISAEEDDIVPHFTVRYWEIPHVNLHSRDEWVDLTITNNSSLSTARIDNGTATSILNDSTPVQTLMVDEDSGFAATMNFRPITVKPGSLLVVEITRVDLAAYDYNIGLLDLFGEYQATQLGMNNLKSVAGGTNHLPMLTKRL